MNAPFHIHQGSVPTRAEMGIRGIGRYLPEACHSIASWAESHRVGTERFERLSGNGASFYYDGEERPVREMAVSAAREALLRADLAGAEVDVLIFSHTRNESVAQPPNSTASFVQNALGLDNARCLSVAQQNCVSVFVAIELARTLLSGNPVLRNILVVTSDHFPRVIDHLRVIDDMAIHSDGACALLLTRDWPQKRVLSVTSKADARFFRADISRIESNPDYYVSTVATIRKALSKAGVPRDRVSRVLPNHVNMPAAFRVTELMRMPPNVLYADNFARRGHVFGADPFINLIDSVPAPGETVLLYSTGMAGCYGAAVIEV